MINCKLFTGNKRSELGLKVSQHLGVALGSVQISRFENGEFFVHYLEDIKHCCVLLLLEVVPSANESIVQLLQMIDAARQVGAEKIIVVLPFYPYARQDKFFVKGSGIASILLSKLIKVSGADQLVTVDLHNPSQCECFEVPTHNITLDDFWLNYFRSNIDINPSTMLVAADKGMKDRVEQWASNLNCSWGYVNKQRNLDGEIVVVDFQGDVQDKDVYLMDDLIDTGCTLFCITNRLKASGAKKIVGVVTHGITREVPLWRLQMSALDALITTDTLPILRSSKFPTEVVSIADVLAESLKQFLE